MFSFKPVKGAVPIARVDGGQLDGAIVWLSNPDGEPIATDTRKCECGEFFSRWSALRQHRRTGHCPYLKALTDAIDAGELFDQPFNDYILNEGQFQVLPYETSDEEGRPCYNQRIYISGQSGCGKSRWAGKWLEEYQNAYPDKKVIAVCHTDMSDDPAYRNVEWDQLDLGDPDFQQVTQDQPLAGGMLDGSICLFDDIDKMEGELKKTAYRLLGQTVMMGRKAGIPVCFCNHLGADRIATRDILNGATAAVVFPRGGSPGQLHYLLTKHIGFTNKGSQKLLQMKPKWAYIHRSWPSFVMTDQRICDMSEIDG